MEGGKEISLFLSIPFIVHIDRAFKTEFLFHRCQLKIATLQCFLSLEVGGVNNVSQEASIHAKIIYFIMSTLLITEGKNNMLFNYIVVI